MLDVVEGCVKAGRSATSRRTARACPADQLGGRGGGLAIDVADHHADVGRGQRAGGGRSMPRAAPVTSATRPARGWVRLVTLTFPEVIVKSRLQR